MLKARYAGLIAIIAFLLSINILGGLWIISTNEIVAPMLPTLAPLPEGELDPVNFSSDEALTNNFAFNKSEVAEAWSQAVESANIEHVTREPKVPATAVAGRMILEFADTMSADEINDYLITVDIEVVETISELNRVIVLSGSDDVLKTLESSAIVATEPDYYATALLSVSPTDPHYDLQWNLQAIGLTALWARLPVNPQSVSVAIIDSGICFQHPDMQATYSDFQFDYVDNDVIPQDVYGHGCSVTGVIASQNNTIGTLGIAPFVEIMPLRVLGENGVGSYSNIARAIIDATNNGADIINLSLGGLQSSQTLQSAIDYALDQDVILVAAAGNSNGNTPLYPAGYDGVIAVGSVNQLGEISAYNHLGVEIFAPGDDVIVPQLNGDTVVSSGTSLAAPHVTGVIALKMMLGQPFSPTDAVLVAAPNPIIEESISEEDLTQPLLIGDILIPREWLTEDEQGSGQFTFGSVFDGYVEQWPNGDVYYTFDSAVSPTNRTRTRQAMDIWEAAANIRFIQRTTQPNYLYIQNSNGNSSFVGMYGGAQDFNMVNWDIRYIIVHELGHALGMWHEQSRYDRDSYVTIDYSEMIDDPYVISNFDIVYDAYTVGEYDFASVMHYFPTAFSRRGQPTVIVKSPWDAVWQNRIGQSAYLSEWDVLGMWALYPCAGNTFDCVTIPDHDYFEEALFIDSLSYNHSVTGGYGTNLATTAVDDPFPSCAFDDSGKTLWYKFSLPASSVTVSTVGSNYDTVLSVWTGTRGNMTQIACSGDANLALTSELTFVPVDGETYYIQVAGELWSILTEADGGDLYLSVEAVPVCFLWEDWIADPSPPVPACPPVDPDYLYAERVNYVNQIDLTWRDNSISETEFRIERSLAGADSWSQIATVPADTVAYSDTTVTCYTDYDYRIIAYRSDDDAVSDPSVIFTQQSSCIDVTAPSNLVEVNALNSVQLGWTDNSPDETSFSIERSPTGADTWSEIGTATADSTSYTDNTGLTCGYTYDYRVFTYREGDTKYSLPSNKITVALTCDPPTAPSNVIVEDVITTRNLTVDWQDNSIETGFTIQRDVSGTWQDAGTVAGNVTTLADTDATLGCYIEYDYRVKATRSTDSKESVYSTIGTGMTSCDILFAPDNLIVTSSLNTVELSWNNNSPDGTSFEIQRSNQGADSWSPLGSVSSTSFSDNSTICGYSYDYRVRQYRSDDAIYSPVSDLVTALQSCSPPITPVNLNVTAVPFTNNFALTWQDNAYNETDYRIERWNDNTDQWDEIDTIAANSTSYVDEDASIACYTNYQYRIRAYRSSDAIYSSYSNEDNDTAWCDPSLISAKVYADSQLTDDVSDVNGFPFPACAYDVSNVHVWEYTPSDSEQYYINTFDSTINTVLLIVQYGAGISPLGCNDDGNSDGTSALFVDLVAGQRYMIIAGGKNGQTGTIDLDMRNIIPATPTPLPTATPLPSPTSQPNTSTVGLFNDGIWHFRDNNSSGSADIIIRYGETLSSEWQPVIGDWNGDGVDGIGLYHNGRWRLRDTVDNALTTEYLFSFGPTDSAWQPVIGDWNGDGVDGIGLYNDGSWILKNDVSAGVADKSFRFNLSDNPDAIPIAGDWDNRAFDRVGLYDNGRWYLALDNQTGTRANVFNYGSVNGDWSPVIGDYDQDGDDTIGVFKNGQWFLRNTNNYGSPDLQFNFRAGNAQPVAGYRGGAAALTLLANAPDISEPDVVPSSTPPAKVIIVSPIPTNTLEPTVTAEPSSTPMPTVTIPPSATPTPIPSDTLEPSLTPSMTLEPSATIEQIDIQAGVSSTSP